MCVDKNQLTMTPPVWPTLWVDSRVELQCLRFHTP